MEVEAVKADIGLIGLGVMGQNLALNMARNGYRAVVYNRTPGVTQRFMEGPARGAENVISAATIEGLVSSLERPRRIMLMVKAGPAVDAVIEQLDSYLGTDDIIIDGGNSHFKDTARRAAALEAAGLRYRNWQAKASGFIPGMKRSSLRPARRSRAIARCRLMAHMVQ